MAPDAVCDAMAKRARKFARAMMRSHYALPLPAAGAAPFAVRTATLVKAAHPSVCGLVPLSLVDTELYMICGPSSSSLFFRQALDCAKLQSTLPLALEAFPVLAGRVVSLPPEGAAPPHPPRTGEWRRGYPRAVDCNNAGAGFTVLDLPGVKLPEDRSAEVAPPFPIMDQGLHLHHMTDNPDAVIFDVLVVYFATGCMLTVSASHALVDGTSGAAFLHFWSALLRGAPLSALPKPLLDRTVYDAACGITGQVCAARQAAQAATLREHQQPSCCGGGGTGVKPKQPTPSAQEAAPTEPPVETESPASPSPRDACAAATAAKQKAVTAATAIATPLPELSPLKGITVWPSVGGWARLLLRMATDSTLGMVRGRGTVIRLLLRFPAAELARLKAKASGPGDESAQLSSNDVLCAAVWRALAQSRRKRGPLDAAGAGDADATFCFVANTRALMLPPEQQLFMGNAVVIAQAELPAAALRTGSLADAAAALRAAKARITPEAVRAEMAFLQAHADSRVTLGEAARNLRWNTLPYDGGCSLWDWSKFAIYGLDFGGCKPFWLEPGLGAPMLLPYVMGAAPAPDGDGSIVYANVPRDEATELLAALRAQ